MKIVKRKSNLIPYRFILNHFEFYLSHRSKNAKQFPNFWSFWGGGIEVEETPEEAMIREIQEELEWKPKCYEFLGTYYDSIPNEKFIYYTEVGRDLENNINICESQGGNFFTIEEIIKSENIIKEDKKVLSDLFDLLNQ
jgi:8-oxo-dGTP diphosphatase